LHYEHLSLSKTSYASTEDWLRMSLHG
jgi:hypothetical protein